MFDIPHRKRLEDVEETEKKEADPHGRQAVRNEVESDHHAEHFVDNNDPRVAAVTRLRVPGRPDSDEKHRDDREDPGPVVPFRKRGKAAGKKEKNRRER